MTAGLATLAVVVEQCLAPAPGGTGRYAFEIARALAATAPAGWAVSTVTAWHRDVAAAIIPGVAGPRRLPCGRRVLAQAWQRGWPPGVAADSVQATTPLAPRRGRRPLVATVHDAVPWTHPETLTPRGVTWHRNTIGRLMLTADAIIVPSEAVADDLAVLFPAGDRIHVVPHGVTPLPEPVDAAARRRALGLPERYVLSVATLEPRKGLDVLIAALAGVPADVGLVVAGPAGWGAVDVGGATAAAGLAPERVRVVGRLGDEDLGAALGGAAVLAMPSRSEGFGLPLLEAMAAGIPVVHSDIAVLREVAGGAGLAVPVGSVAGLAAALTAVLDSPGDAARMAAAGRRRATGFSWDRAGRATWAIHRAVTGR